MGKRDKKKKREKKKGTAAEKVSLSSPTFPLSSTSPLSL
jgi:hypothetical protein